MASADVQFDEGHMWVRVDEDKAVVGLTDYAQDKMGEVIFMELPEEGAMVIRGDTCGTLESVKSVEDLLAPVSGEVTSINEDVLDAPEAVNEDPYGEGWLFEVRIEDQSELSSLMSEEDYNGLLDSMEGDDDEEF